MCIFMSGCGKRALKAAVAGALMFPSETLDLWSFPSDSFLLCLDQQSGYGKVSRRGGHQNSYKPY